MRHPNIQKLAPDEYDAWLWAYVDFWRSQSGQAQDKYHEASAVLKAKLPGILEDHISLHTFELDQIEEYLQKTQEKEKKEPEIEAYTLTVKEGEGSWFYLVWKRFLVRQQYDFRNQAEAEHNAKVWIAKQSEYWVGKN